MMRTVHNRKGDTVSTVMIHKIVDFSDDLEAHWDGIVDAIQEYLSRLEHRPQFREFSDEEDQRNFGGEWYLPVDCVGVELPSPILLPTPALGLEQRVVVLPVQSYTDRLYVSVRLIPRERLLLNGNLYVDVVRED